MVNNEWFLAAKAAYGAPAMRKPTREPAYSLGANPDWVAEFTDSSGVHVLGETKVYNNLSTDRTKLRRCAVYAFGATEYDLRVKIFLGEHAATAAAPLIPRLDGEPHPSGKYTMALEGGHR